MAGTKVFSDGFESYGGTWPASWLPPVAPYDGYPYKCAVTGSDPRDGYAWRLHWESCRINAGDALRPAHSGTYYMHHQCSTELPDPYLDGQTATSIATSAVIGASTEDGFSYPSNGSDFRLYESIATDYTFLRFWFRLTDNWRMGAIGTNYHTDFTVVSATASSVTVSPAVVKEAASGGGNRTYYVSVVHNGVRQSRRVTNGTGTWTTLNTATPWDTLPVAGDIGITGSICDSFKFIRCGYGDAGDTSVYLTTGCEDNLLTAGWGYNLVLATTVRRVYGRALDQSGNPILFDDGNWHCVCLKQQVTSYSNAQDPNITMSVWWDDWNCTRATPDLTSTNAYDDTVSTRMRRIYICENFQGNYPANLLGFDIDDIEIWNGEPTSGELQGVRRVLQYGFEDFTGDVETTPGYIFSTNESAYWDAHKASTFIRAGSFNSGARPAHSGSYYFHRQFNTQHADLYLNGGGVATSINAYCNVGINGTYPLASGSSLSLPTAIASKHVFVRFYFRCTDNWKNQIATDGNSLSSSYYKFVVLSGNGPVGDQGSAFVHLMCGGTGAGLPGNETDTRFLLYDVSTANYQTIASGIDLQDGNWHSACVQFSLNNDTGSVGNLTTSVWFDDWDIVYSAKGSRTTTSIDFGTGFRLLQTGVNFSARYPDTLMGIDIDYIEIFNGLVTSSDLVSGSLGYTPLSYGMQYYWRIRARDEQGVESAWSGQEGDSFAFMSTTSTSTSSSSTSSTTTILTTSSFTTFIEDTPPAHLYANDTSIGAALGRVNPTDLVDLTPALSTRVYPHTGRNVTRVKLQVSTDSSFATVDKWNSGWVELVTPKGIAERTEDIEYGRT